MNPGIENLISAIRVDPHINLHQQQVLIDKVNSPNFFENIMHGVFGSALALVISKYLKLSRTSQILLTIAGYGIGKAMWDTYDQDSKFSRYDHKTKMHEIK